jgi:hypothetical protein
MTTEGADRINKLVHKTSEPNFPSHRHIAAALNISTATISTTHFR